MKEPFASPPVVCYQHKKHDERETIKTCVYTLSATTQQKTPSTITTTTTCQNRTNKLLTMNKESTVTTTTTTTIPSSPWDSLDETFRSYLSECGISAADFNGSSVTERATLRNSFLEQQQRFQKNDDDASIRKRRLEDLLAYHKVVLETTTSKSSKLLKVRKTPDNSKRCFLCGVSGTPANKIEAAHILQKQDIYATGGDDALHTFDILKGWANGHGWNRPFKMHEPMNLIWLCHTHNLAFDSHKFGLALLGLDNFVGFCSYEMDYDTLVNTANERLRDENEPFYDMSYVSRRAVGMRLFKAQQSGHYLNHDNTDAWETIVRLSAAASMDLDASEAEDDEETTLDLEHA